MKEDKISRRSFLGKLGRAFVGATLVGKVLESDAKANELKFTISTTSPDISTSRCKVYHHSWCNKDSPYLEAQEPALDIYVHTDGQALGTDGEPAESMDPKTVYISGRGTSGPVEADVTDSILELFDENNMIGKKIMGALYQRVDDGKGGFKYEEVGKYDLWNMHEAQQKINLTVNPGITRGLDFYPSHKFEVSFSYNNKADFDNDGDVDFSDHSILAGSFRRPIGNYLADISGPEGISDAVVDKFDLKEFAANWLH